MARAPVSRLMKHAGGLTGRILYGWRSPLEAIQSEVSAHHGEPRLLAYAFGASVFLTLGPVLAEVVRPALAVGEDRSAWFAARLLIGLSFLPLGLYVSAAMVRAICLGFGGVGDWKAARLALFWSALVSGPLAMLAHVAGAVISVTWLGGAVAGLLWAVWLAPAVSATMGFELRRAYVALGVLAVASLGMQAAM
jgi:hypothetical protein